MAIRVKSICDELIAFLASQTVDARYSLAPQYDTETKGAQYFVTPLSSETARTARDGVSNTVTVQILTCCYVTSHSDAIVEILLDQTEDLKEALIGGVLTDAQGNEWLVDEATCSGTQFLSSSMMQGGLIDSKEFEENYVVQIPLVVTLSNNGA